MKPTTVSGREYLVMVLRPVPPSGTASLAPGRVDLHAAYRVLAPSPVGAAASISPPDPSCKVEVMLLSKARQSQDPLVIEALRRVERGLSGTG